MTRPDVAAPRRRGKGLVAGLVRRLLGIRAKLRRASLLAELDIGEGTRISLGNVDGIFPHLVHVGRNCIFAPTAMLLTHDASYYLHTGQYRVAPVHVGDNVFLGYNAVVMPGVRIGDEAIIGAGAVVTKDVPCGSVVAGFPGHFVMATTDPMTPRPAIGLFRSPFAGKVPAEVTPGDVDEFARGARSVLKT